MPPCSAGRDPARRLEYAQHLAATEEHFFNNVEGGIKDLYNWYQAYRSESVWKRAAGVYVRILSKPQLFIEGNNRTGSLIVSYLLMRAGLPPFVLTLDNAEWLLQSVIGHPQPAKHGVKALYELPKIKKNMQLSWKNKLPDPEEFFVSDQPVPVYLGGRMMKTYPMLDKCRASSGRAASDQAFHPDGRVQAPTHPYFV